MENLTLGQYELVYNSISFGIASMAAATIFFWLGRGSVAPQFRAALTITGLVTFIAAYHYWRIFDSWGSAFIVDAAAGTVAPSGAKFNDAYRYVDWLLTVPLLLIELILVMGLTRAATISKSLRLGALAALMVALGYPGEIAGSMGARLLWGGLSMIPFTLILIELFVGLRSSVNSQPPQARGLVNFAIVLTVASWSFYPIVYFAPFVLGAENANIATMSGAAATIVQVGYTIADVVAKAVFGVVIFMIASAKSQEWRASQSGQAVAPAQ